MSDSSTGTPAAAAGTSTNPWTGTPITLATGDNAVMPQTTNGTMIFAATNKSTTNNDGTVYLTSGGSAPTPIDVPALANAPTIQINNWQANNLSVSNQSTANVTPILIQAVGPGLAGTTPANLPIGSSITLTPGSAAQGTARPQFMTMRIQSTASTVGVLGIIGGKLDGTGNNGYVISVNDSQNGNTGPNTGKTPPPGYYATTTNNSYNFQFNWGSSAVFISNLSPSTAENLSITLSAL
ncbi:hypothetical protein [Longimicrobium sp.]|uniref:hypothetical protein n=1 Tax=Longimicrobium sp. TaxID=2029185 RepID=UPI003B3AF51E